MNSIKVYLISSILAIIVLVLFVSTIQGYTKSMQASEELFDAKLADIANLLATSPFSNINSYPPSATQAGKTTTASLDSTQSSNLVYQIWDSKQRLIASSLTTPIIVDFNDHTDYENIQANRWRTLMQYYPNTQHWVWVGEKQDLRFELAEGVILESIIPSLIVIPLLGIIILLVIQRGIHPIKELASQIASRKANDLHSITLTEIPTELLNLTESVNQLFARLQASFEREKRLASDAAHELRTPIAALELQVQNFLAEQPDHADVHALANTARRLSHLVEQILTLNKTTPELFTRRMHPMNIAPVIRHLVANLYPLFENKQLTVELQADDVIIETDEFAIETLFSNLLINAIKYTPMQGNILIKLYSHNEQIIAEIHDSGLGIAQELRTRVMERFYRLDRDKSDANVIGSGLGLSIVQHVVELHQAKFSLKDSQFAQGLCAQIIFKSSSINC